MRKIKNKPLTATLRERIRRAVLDHRFAARVLELRVEEGAIAMAVRAAYYSEEERDVMDKHPRLFSEERYICARFGMYSNMVHFYGTDGTLHFVTLGRPSRMAVEPITDQKLVARYEHWRADEKALEEQREQAFRTVTATLASFKSVKALLDGWPEVAPFIPADAEPPPPRQLPVVQVDELNRMLNLPKLVACAICGKMADNVHLSDGTCERCHNEEAGDIIALVEGA